MSQNFFIQGFSDNTYADQVRWVLNTPNLEHAIVSTAFLNEDGVNLIEQSLDQIIDRTVFFCGIRNDITSFQGILRLVERGQTVYLVDTGSRSRIFHPKIYFAQGEQASRLLVGSGNMTIGGLNNNIEAGLGLELMMNNDTDCNFVQQLKSQFDVLPGAYPRNVFLATNREQLELLRDGGKLLDEAETAPPRPSTSSNQSIPDLVPRIQLPVNLVYPIVKRSTRRRQRARTAIRPAADLSPIVLASIPTNLIKVWQSKPLTERDLNIPRGTTTNPAGSMSLDKGLLDEQIDHRHYFRDEVFADLEWRPSSRRGSEQVEETTASFQLVIKNRNYGEFQLQIRHTTSTDTVAYEQHNAMTRLSWGEMRIHIAKPDYIGRNLTLYADENDTNNFVIEVD